MRVLQLGVVTDNFFGSRRQNSRLLLYFAHEKFIGFGLLTHGLPSYHHPLLLSIHFAIVLSWMESLTKSVVVQHFLLQPGDRVLPLRSSSRWHKGLF